MKFHLLSHKENYMRFELLAGKHSEKTKKGVKIFKEGDIIDTPHNLAKMFGKDKFRKISGPGIASADEESDEDDPHPEKTSKKVVTIKKGEPSEARGTDVTSDHKKAEKNGLKVFQRGDLFHVYEGNDTAPLNKHGLEAGKVDAYVTKWLEG